MSNGLKLSLTPQEIELIERVVYDEARGEGKEGRDAVRAVIYNRLAANRRDLGGNTVLGVLNHPKQFQGVMEKGEGNVVNLNLPEKQRQQYLEEHVDFVQKGSDPTNGATFFLNPEAAKNPFNKDREGLRIGNHVYYDNYAGNVVPVPNYEIAIDNFELGFPMTSLREEEEYSNVPYEVLRETATDRANLVGYEFTDRDELMSGEKAIERQLGTVDSMGFDDFGITYDPIELPYAERPEIGGGYTVNQGDTLYSISQRIGVPVEEIAKRNNIMNNMIFPGQRLLY